MLRRTTVIPCPSGLDSPHALVRIHPGQENGKILQKLLRAAANWIASSKGPRKWLTPPHLSPTAARSWPQALKNSSCPTIKNSVPSISNCCSYSPGQWSSACFVRRWCCPAYTLVSACVLLTLLAWKNSLFLIVHVQSLDQSQHFTETWLQNLSWCASWSRHYPWLRCHWSCSSERPVSLSVAWTHCLLPPAACCASAYCSSDCSTSPSPYSWGAKSLSCLGSQIGKMGCHTLHFWPPCSSPHASVSPCHAAWWSSLSFPDHFEDLGQPPAMCFLQNSSNA